MTNKLTLTEQEELFAKDCKLINLKYEYNGYTGDERWAIITELSVKELWEKYPLVIERYIDDSHVEVGDDLYHICEFAERMEQCGATFIPLRSDLPEVCYSILPSTGDVIIIKHGESGY